jgi:ribosomal protein S18 acetylase RimI-like enzyme
MSIVYFKRFKMEVDLYEAPPMPLLPRGYSWAPWSEDLAEAHAEVKYYCFQEEVDANVFPSLGSRQGCHLLMREISRKAGFLPEATWLILCPAGYCGTVQGVRERGAVGAIQNLGVMPMHRGLGLGKALMAMALHGFCRAGLGRAVLEVTAQNEAAVKLYRSLGFRSLKTVYKAVETDAALEAAGQYDI